MVHTGVLDGVLVADSAGWELHAMKSSTDRGVAGYFPCMAADGDSADKEQHTNTEACNGQRRVQRGEQIKLDVPPSRATKPRAKMKPWVV